jgi:hypothetical protein
MWPVKMTGEVKKWPVKRHFLSVIVRWPAVILSFEYGVSKNVEILIFSIINYRTGNGIYILQD